MKSTGKFSFAMFLVSGLAAQAFAISYVVPRDQFEIERSSAIIVGRVLSSHSASSPRFGIETVTDIVLEEAIKGDVGSVVQIHEPGGVIGDEARIISGIPGFIDGDRVLLFIYQRENGDYTVSDLELGAFRFAKDVAGRDLVVRNELDGWNLDGTAHKEQPRSAEPFLRFVRSIVRGEAAAEDYFVPVLPLAESHGQAKATIDARHSADDAAVTATSYTVSFNGGLGARWNVFPSAVSWNQGSSEIGALGNGTAQVNAAFDSWNAGGAHYVLASASPNSNGLMDASDSVNNIVFEKNLTSAGVQAYSCTQGGILGMGGIHFALFNNGTHVFHGETFGTTREVDVSMNQGIGLCTLAQFPLEAFATVVTHEVGHTLGFRHADQNRTQDAACSTDPALDCSGSAVMTHIVVMGLNGHLTSWDSSAVSNVYGNGPACTPPSITQQPAGSTITNGNTAQLSVVATGTPTLTYQWFIGPSGNASAPLGGASAASVSVSPSVTTTYWVRVTGQCLPVANSNAVTVTVNPAACPAVVPGSPQATAANGGIQLSITASGGTSFTYQWFQGVSSGAGSPIGAGNPLFVNPAQTTTYWCHVTNDCGNSVNSDVVSAVVIVCSPPQILIQPQDQKADAGTTVSLTVGFTGTNPTVSWFRGARGSTSNPVGSGQTITSPLLTQTTQFWTRISNSCGSTDSNAVTITVTPKVSRRHAAQH